MHCCSANENYPVILDDHAKDATGITSNTSKSKHGDDYTCDISRLDSNMYMWDDDGPRPSPTINPTIIPPQCLSQSKYITMPPMATKGMLEVAQNVATLDGFVSLGKSNVTKKEF